MHFLTHEMRGMLARVGGRARNALLAALVACCALPAHADLAGVRNNLAQSMRAMKESFAPSSVTETLIKGLYRWDQGRNVGPIYVNDAYTLMLVTDGTKVVRWDQPVANPQPITDTEKTALLSDMMRNIRFDKLIHIQQGTGVNQVVLLSAFDCPFCVKFERMLDIAGDRVNLDLYIVPSTLNADNNANVSTVANIWCATDNAAVWRTTLVKAARGYFIAPRVGCDVSMQATNDIEIILRSLGLFKAYPFMIFGTGQVSIADGNAAGFAGQLAKAPGKTFWAQANPDKYAQFRASAVAANSAAATNPAPGKPRTLKDLFRRTAHPPSDTSAPPANGGDASSVN